MIVWVFVFCHFAGCPAAVLCDILFFCLMFASCRWIWFVYGKSYYSIQFKLSLQLISSLEPSLFLSFRVLSKTPKFMSFTNFLVVTNKQNITNNITNIISTNFISKLWSVSKQLFSLFFCQFIIDNSFK